MSHEVSINNGRRHPAVRPDRTGRRSLRVILVMNGSPLPFGHAVGRWYWVLLTGLVERGHRVTAFATCDDLSEANTLKSVFLAGHYDLRCYRLARRSKLQNLRRPYSYMLHAPLLGNLRAELQRGFDILHMESIWSGWVGIDFNRAKALLNFHSLYDIDQSNVRPSGIRDRIYRLLRARAEYQLLRSYQRLLTLTPRLRDAAGVIAPKAQIRVVPLGLDTSLYPFLPKEKLIAEPVVSMIGSMNWHPNYSAAVRLLTRLWPAIKHEVPKAKLRIVGRFARKHLSHLEVANRSDVEVLENVLHIQPYFERSQVLLYAPPVASGMKVKVLEAFAYGIPVVTNSEGVEGLSAQDGVHAGICNDDAGLIQRTVVLLQNPASREAQRIAARRLLELECGANRTLDQLEDYYMELAGEHAQALP
jgi:polysaccharide biosynthesis protein PslH